MNSSTEKRLETLISKQLADGLSDAEAKELNALLVSSEAARKQYILQCQLHSTLLEESEMLTELQTEASGDKVVQMFKEDASSKVEPAKGGLKLFIISAAGLAACAAIAILVVSNSNKPEVTVAAADVPQTSVTIPEASPDEIQERYERTIAALMNSGSMDRPTAKTVANKDSSIRFNRDIRPVISDKCYHCHGPDAATREAGLRLDTREGLLSELSGGRYAIIPGDPDNSEFYKRIIATDDDEIMPPPSSHKHLTSEEIKLLRAWIKQGATWEDHWSFTSIQRPIIPEVENADKVKNPIDNFILRRVEESGLTPAEEADRHTLVRRVSFDTRGLPPSNEEIEAFVNDPSPDAYEKMVDRFLGDEKFGEHRARYWLDAARYADTHGYHKDNYRSIWPYRDWVVNAFNANMPFDQFTLEQIAGDLLPNPTQSQLIATGFNRCNPTTDEGGAIDDEYYAIYALDRVEATSTVWLGLTMSCAACHDHKFDPLSTKEFYQMTAFFRNTTQLAMDGNAVETPPSIRVYSDQQLAKKAKLESTIQATEEELLPILAKYIKSKADQETTTMWPTEDLLDISAALGEEGIAIDDATQMLFPDNGKLSVNEPFTVSFWIKIPPKGTLKKTELFGRYDLDKKRDGWKV